MIVKLIKDHIFVTKVVPVGSIVELTNGNGQELVDKGIAIDVTLQYKREVEKSNLEAIKEQEEIANKADEDRVDLLADKVVEKLKKPKKNTNKNK